MTVTTRAVYDKSGNAPFPILLNDVTITTPIAASNTFSEWVHIHPGKFSVALSGTWTGTITLQWSFDLVNINDYKTYTANGSDILEEPSGAWWRFGAKAGALASGSAVGSITQ